MYLVGAGTHPGAGVPGQLSSAKVLDRVVPHAAILLTSTPWDMAVCRTLLQTGSRSFSAAARLLPAAIRDPTLALYAFCREADDIIDGHDNEPGHDLDWLRDRLHLAYAGRPLPLPVDRAFALVVDRFAIPRCLPEALLEGFAWDAEGRRYPDLPALSPDYGGEWSS